ncbi:MAG: hypothetical protein RSB96_04045 [Oscillospiraceae bacterium]
MISLTAKQELRLRKEVSLIIGNIYASGFSLEESYAISFHTALLYLHLKSQGEQLTTIHQILTRFSLSEISKQVSLLSTQEGAVNLNFKEDL